MMKKLKKKKQRKKPRPRVPIEAVLKLKSHAITTKKGKKGYNRKTSKKQAKNIITQEIQS